MNTATNTTKPTTNASLLQATSFVEVLSFMDREPIRSGGGVNYWNVHPSGSYSLDVQVGEKAAEELLAYIAAHPSWGNISLPQMVVLDMAEQAKSINNRGFIVGFMSRISKYAAASAWFKAQGDA